MLNKEDKVLYFDIETSLSVAYVWGLGKQYVDVKQLKKERKILTIAYMWEGDEYPTKLKMDMKKHKQDKYDDDADKDMLVEFMRIYRRANLAVAHNGRNFDIARIRARLVKYGLPDISPVLFDDSYMLYRNIDMTSHKLDYIGRYLSVGRKKGAEEGFSLWVKVQEGDRAALNRMAEYNANDVILLRKVYLKLRPYAKSSLNLAALHGEAGQCPGCAGKLVKDGFKMLGLRKVQYFECKECGKKCTNGVNLNSKLRGLPR